MSPPSIIPRGGDDDDTPSPPPPTKITTLIFDIDDTLYDVANNFTCHRNTHGATSFMLKHLHFTSPSDATRVRDHYFEKYHSTAKALTVAQSEGQLPPTAPPFDLRDLAKHWVDELDYSLLGGPDRELVDMLRDCPLRMVAFTNGPREYALKVLKTLDLLRDDGGGGVFAAEDVFAVDDVLPHCKPEAGAFEEVFRRIGVQAEECVMVEDSMKNVKCAKALGMKTVLVLGTRVRTEEEAVINGEVPDERHESVDCCVRLVSEMRGRLGSLWEGCPAVFEVT